MFLIVVEVLVVGPFLFFKFYLDFHSSYSSVVGVGVHYNRVRIITGTTTFSAI